MASRWLFFLEAIGLTMDTRISCIVVPHILLQSLKFPPRKVKGCLSGWSGLGLSPMAVKGCLTGWPGLGRGARAVKGSLTGWLGWAGLGLGPEWRASIPGELLRLQSTLVSQSHWLVSTLYLGELVRTRERKKAFTRWAMGDKFTWKDRKDEMQYWKKGTCSLTWVP